jgi:predicted transcriptional regulator
MDREIKTRLEKQAASEERSAAYLVQKVLTDYLDAKDYEQKIFDEAFREADKGVFISGEAEHRWMESWDTENELPMPEPDIYPAGRRAG